MRKHLVAGMSALIGVVGCGKQDFGDSAYVLLRVSSVNSETPGLRAYFIDEGAQLNGISCRELMTLANEAVEIRKANGETHLVKYECVSVAEARARGFK